MGNNLYNSRRKKEIIMIVDVEKEQVKGLKNDFNFIKECL